MTPDSAITALVNCDDAYAFVDVRAESEFADAHVQGFSNLPILTNDERHLVGSCYKQYGQDAALALGQQLTAPHKAQRIAAWRELAEGRVLVVCCWRGGARSRIACEWLAEAGVATVRVSGGYKAMRQRLRERVMQPPPLRVLSGSTGSGKTALLREVTVAKVDLEALANHRGSAFGECGAQPTQTQFENDLALALWRSETCYLVEDESRLIGKIELPLPFKNAMYQAPVLLLEESVDARVRNIFDEYVVQALSLYSEPLHVKNALADNIGRLKNKLGTELYRQLISALEAAFEQPSAQLNWHREWIQPLLQHYYDSRYQYAFEQHHRHIAVRGNAEIIKAFLLNTF